MDDTARLGVIVHVYYLEIAEQLIGILEEIREPISVYFSTPETNVDQLRELLRPVRFVWEIFSMENRGRDVAPFIEIMKRIRSKSHKFILKLHTKKSVHVADGDVWRDESYQMLASPNQVEALLAELEAKPDLGIIGATGYVIPMSAYWGANKSTVRWLAGRMGEPSIDEDNDLFVAGTMFMGRWGAFKPLLSLNIGVEDFEPEEGQIDGTLAHAIERAITYSAKAAHMKIVSARIWVEEDPDIISYEGTKIFRFAEPG